MKQIQLSRTRLILLLCTPIAIVLGAGQAHASIGDFVWAKSLGDTGNNYGRALAVDSAGNVYAIGSFEGTADFNPGEGVYDLTSAGLGDVFVCKLDVNGNFVWARAFGGTGEDIGQAIALDNSGNVFITGDFTGTADFDPGAGTFNQTSAGVFDLFITKLDANGDFVWAHAFGSSGYDYGRSVAADSTGNVYFTGAFANTVDFDPGAGVFNLNEIANRDIYIAKLDATGNFVWAKSVEGPGLDEGKALNLDPQGNVCVTGEFTGTADFDPGAGTFNLVDEGNYNAFALKLGTDGSFIWAKALGGLGDVHALSLAVDPVGNVYTTGYFYGMSDFDPSAASFNLTPLGAADVYISKLDANGDFLGAWAFGGTSSEYGNAIAVDGVGNIYTTGYFYVTADFNPGAGVFDLTAPSGGASDVFVSKLNSNGDFVWAQNLGGVNGDIGNSIAIDSASNIYMTGSFIFMADFYPGPVEINLVAPGGNNNAFVSKISGVSEYHSADQNNDWIIQLSELLRVIQFFSLFGYHAPCPEVTEDGFCPGAP